MFDTKKILLVEDDPSLGFVIKDNLTMKGYEVTLCKDGQEGERAFFDNGYNLCIFDVMLPKKDGFSLARSVRKKNADVPILFLTAKSMIEDKLEGFGTGADDYITKPFSLEELLCRIEVFLRRAPLISHIEQKIVFLGKYEFDFSNLTLKTRSAEKTLTQKEAEVLKLLYQNRERVLKREEILKQVWGDDDYFMGRSMDVFISKLRKYLKEDPSVQIVNYHGVGFKLEA
jgi:DNA-binding response OmpR family regulator